MTGSAAPTATDRQEQLARIERMNAETRKFFEEGLKLSAEARKLARDATIAPYTAIVAAFTAGAAVAVVTLVKILGRDRRRVTWGRRRARSGRSPDRW